MEHVGIRSRCLARLQAQRTSVLVTCRVVLWALHQTAALLGAPIDDLYDVDELLLVEQLEARHSEAVELSRL